MDSLVSIEDLNIEISKPPNLSPLSKEACKRLGITPAELVYKPLSFFQKTSNVEETAQTKFNFSEKKRLEKIQWIRDEKNKIEKEGQKSREKSNYVSQAESSVMNSKMIEREKKELEKIERKQKQDLQQMIEYQLKTEAIRQKNEEKMEKAKKREEQRQIELQKNDLNKKNKREKKKRKKEESNLV